MSQGAARKFEFSDLEFDSQSGELIRNGRKLRVSEQAARILTILLERAGTVVSRDELRDLLWPEREFVGYDHSINNAISQLRTALRDDSRTPCLIETIPKRGYRFLEEVRTATPPAAELVPQPIPANGSEIEKEKDDAWESKIQVAASEPRPRPRIRMPGVLWGVRPAAKFVLAAVAVLVVVAAGLVFAGYSRRSSSASSYIYMGIAPFEVSGGGAEELANSFRVDLIDSLAQLPVVRVRASHSLNNIKQDDAAIRSKAQALGLDTLLFGKFTFEGNQCTLQFELIRGRDASHLASFRYSGTKDALGTIRDRVQRDIFTRLELASNANRPAPGSTANPRAYEAYLWGRYYLTQWRDESLARAIKEFQSAIDEDPGFSKAYAGMASAYMIMADHAAASPEESYSKAGQLAAKTVQIDPSLAEGHSMVGYIALHKDWNFPLAEKELRQAIELDSGQAVYHLWLAQLLTLQGRFDESLQEVDLAHAADPFWPPVYMTEIYASYAARQHPRAMKSAQKLIELMPDWPLAHNQRGWLLWYSGRHLEAIAEWRQMAVMEKDVARVELEDRGLEAYRRGGVHAYAQLRLAAIKSHPNWAHALTDFVPAEWYVFAGEKEKAFKALEELINRRDAAALQLAVNPAYYDLYSDPRFQTLLSRIGAKLPQQSAKPVLQASK